MPKNKYDLNDGEVSDKATSADQTEWPGSINNIRIAEYIGMIYNPRKVILMNFVLGLTRGLGMGIGFTVLAGIVLYLMRSWVNLPVVGKLIAELLDIIDTYR